MARMVDCGAGPRRELAEARRREKARSKRLWMLFLFLLSVGAASAAASALTHMRLFRVILIAACAALAFFPLCISGSGSSRISVLSAGAAGEEDAAALNNYLYQLQEQLDYVLTNLGSENMNEEFLKNMGGGTR